MAETYKRGGVWYARYVDASGKPMRTSLKVRAGVPNEAVEVQKALAALLIHGDATAAQKPTGGMTIDQAYRKADREHWADTADRRNVASRYGDVKDFFGIDTPLASLTGSRVSEFKTWLKASPSARVEDGWPGPGRGNSDKTVNRKLSVLSKILHLAADEWDVPGLDKLPVMKRKKEERGRIRWLTEAEEATLLAFLRSGAGGAQRLAGGAWHDQAFVPNPSTIVPREGCNDFADMCEVLVDTGMRPSELRRVQDRDITWSGVPKVYIPKSKGGAQRSIELTERATRHFHARIRRDVDADARMKGSSQPFAQPDEDRCVQLWDHARKAMGLERDEEFVTYALRHTFAMRMVEASVDIRVISYLMGHRKLETTMIYAHVSSTVASGAIRRMEAVRKGVVEQGARLEVVAGKAS